MVANGISVLLEFSHLLEVEIYIQTIYIWYWNQENSYLQVQYLNCFTKENREIVGVPRSKPLGGSKVDSAFHPSEDEFLGI